MGPPISTVDAKIQRNLLSQHWNDIAYLYNKFLIGLLLVTFPFMITLACGQALLCTAYLALSLGHDEPPEYSHLPNEAKYVTLDDDMRDDLDRSLQDISSIRDYYNSLLALYTATNGDNWSDSSWVFNGQENTDYCNFNGVSCLQVDLGGTIANSIFGLNLLNFGLSGSLPTEMFDSTTGLIDLQKLNLSGNSLLVSTIPSEIGMVSSLQTLKLRRTGIDGSLPSEFANLNGMLELDLSLAPGLTGSISSLMDWTSLQVLDLSSSYLSGNVTEPMSWFSSLIYLDLDGTTFSGTIPTEIGYTLTSLEVLRLDNNIQVSGSIPTTIGLLSSLRTLELDDTSITGPIPSEMGLLTNLNYLEIGGSSILGTLPTELGNLNSLKNLYIIDSLLTGSLPSEFGTLLSLNTLVIKWNAVGGMLPSEIGNLSSLEKLNIDHSSFTGQLPTAIGQLSNLKYLELDDIDFVGSIPSEIGLLTSLKYLTLHNTNWESSLPTEFGFLTSLVTLYAGYASISGLIPSELGMLESLKILELYKNNFSGTIPTEVGLMGSLISFQLWNNPSVTGVLPTQLGLLTSLVYLSTDETHISGTVPVELSNNLLVEEYYLCYNNLSGSVPSQIFALANLMNLCLADTYLSGTIPTTISGYLVELHISFASFSGTIPVEVTSLPNISEIFLSDNNLNGQLPQVYGSNIIIFDASKNNLSGTIPSELFLVTSIEEIYLSSNILTGTIPQLGENFITDIELHANALTGSVDCNFEIRMTADCSEGEVTCSCCECYGTPSTTPSTMPSTAPSTTPITMPSTMPSTAPSTMPSTAPRTSPSTSPSELPSNFPSRLPSKLPSMGPTTVSNWPSIGPTNLRSHVPSSQPSIFPSYKPSLTPSTLPSFFPSVLPTLSPSLNPSFTPSTLPSYFPSVAPTVSPSISPTQSPSIAPSKYPSKFSTVEPSTSPNVTSNRTNQPIISSLPSMNVSSQPTFTATNPIQASSALPSVTVLSVNPSHVPSFAESLRPSTIPSILASSSTILSILMVGLLETLSDAAISVFENTLLTYFQANSQGMVIKSVTLLSIGTGRRRLRTTENVGSIEFRSLQATAMSVKVHVTANTSQQAPTTLYATCTTTISSNSNNIVTDLRQADASFSTLESLVSEDTSMIPSSTPSQSSAPILLSSPNPSQIPSDSPSDIILFSSSPTITSWNLPSTNPSLSKHLSSYPSVFPTAKPSAHPTPSPSVYPSEAPSLTPPVTTVFSVPYTRSTNMTDPEGVSQNETVSLMQMTEEDEALMDYFLIKYGSNCTIEECRRNLNNDIHPFFIENVTSYITNTTNCTSNSVDRNQLVCYNIDTNVTVTRYPVMFPQNRSNLIVLTTVLGFMDERHIEYIPLVPVPRIVTTKLSITFKGVVNDEMDEDQTADFVDTLFDFLEEILGLFEPPILVDDVIFDHQTLSVNVTGYEQESDMRLLRAVTREDYKSANNTNSTESNELTIVVTVVGEYLPPPDIDFDDILIDVFDEEGQEDFIVAIDESDNAYFEPVIDKITIKSVATVNDLDLVASSRNGDSAFGSLGVTGGVIVVVASSVFTVIVAALLWRKRARIILSKKLDEELRIQYRKD